MYSGKINFKNKKNEYNAGLYIIEDCNFEDLNNINTYLHKEEIEKYLSLKVDAVKQRFCLGRYCGKRAIALINKTFKPNEILITNGLFGEPVVKNLPGIQCSITHRHTSGAALSFSNELMMGIDLENIDDEQVQNIRTQLTEKELELKKKSDLNEKAFCFLLWTSKESLAKTIRTGFTVPMELFEIENLIKTGKEMNIVYKYFKQFTTKCFITDTLSISITYPVFLEWDMPLDLINSF